MNLHDVFERSSDAFLQRYPAGERTLSRFTTSFFNECINDTGKREAVQDLLTHPEKILDLLIASGKPFDVYTPRWAGAISWDSYVRTEDQEHFLEKVADNAPFLPDLIEQHKAKGVKPLVTVLPGLGERGTNYLLINKINPAQPVVVKPYQGEEEADIGKMFSGTLGPVQYSAGNRSFAEELMLSLRPEDGSSNPPNGLWEDIGVFLQHPRTAGTMAAYLFSTMHEKRVVYCAWNWAEEVRAKVIERVVQLPKILDFGSAYVYEEGKQKDWEPRNSWEEAREVDFTNIRNAFKTIYQSHPAHGREAISQFEKEYRALIKQS